MTVNNGSTTAMTLVSVNVGKPLTKSDGRREFSTGIYKQPVAGRVMVRKLNLDGDAQADLIAHGGPYKAVYAYSADHYPYWQQQMGQEYPYGQFGENLTLTGALEHEIYIGDILRIGDVQIQVTQPRVPCFKLAHKMGEPTFVKRFMQAKRTGFYLRVLEEGEIGVGDTVERVHTDPQQVSVHDIFHLLYADQTDRALARRALEIDALAPGWRGSMLEVLER